MNRDVHEDLLEGQNKPTIEQVDWVFNHLIDHAEQGGTFRYLIYDRMGYDTKAYFVLCGCGMYLHNTLSGCLKKRAPVSLGFELKKDGDEKNGKKRRKSK